MEVIIISIKNDFVLKHIESLPIGTKISVRGLSNELCISEGTVYKAIKNAEAMGLVVTRPKAGTSRVDSSVCEEQRSITVSELSKSFGLTVIAGKTNSDTIIKRVIICDGDEAQLSRHLSGRNPKHILCLVGNRPEFHRMVIEAGANLLVTDGGKASDYDIIQAENKGVCVMYSVQNTFTLMRLLDNHFSGRKQLDGGNSISEWMQTPDYLYRNDIVADWHNFYQHNLNGLNKYPIVDDDLNIAGYLDISRAFAAMPSQKLSGLTAGDGDLLTVERSADIDDLAKKMVLSGSHLAAVVDGSKMEGVISSNDLLRYYMYSEDSKSGAFQVETFLSIDSDVSTENQLVYRLRIPEREVKNLSNLQMGIMLAASSKHVQAAGCSSFKLDSGTFYAPKSVEFSEDLMLTSSLTHSGSGGYVVEVEVHDTSASYAKALLIFSNT